MIVAIYEENEVGTGHGMHFVNTDDFNTSKKEEVHYLNAIVRALEREDKYGFGGESCNVMLHNILQGDFGSTKVKQIKPPCKVDKAVYIWCK